MQAEARNARATGAVRIAAMAMGFVLSAAHESVAQQHARDAAAASDVLIPNLLGNPWHLRDRASLNGRRRLQPTPGSNLLVDSRALRRTVFPATAAHPGSRDTGRHPAGHRRPPAT